MTKNSKYLTFGKNIGGKLFFIEIRPSKKGDKIVIYLYDNQNKFLGVIGELQYSGKLRYKSYYTNIKKISNNTNIPFEDIISTVNNIVNEYHDEILSKYSEFFETSEIADTEDSISIFDKISRVEDELLNWLKENNKEYIPESVLKSTLKKYKLSMQDFIMYTRSFYEKEPKKWYPLT